MGRGALEYNDRGIEGNRAIGILGHRGRAVQGYGGTGAEVAEM